MPENPRVLKISVLGAPNSGKSSIVNRLMNRRITPVSSKVNTTRYNLTGVLTNGDSQLIILDTPGVVPLYKKRSFNLERKMIIDPHSSLWEADLVIVVHDSSNRYTKFNIDEEVLKCLFVHPEKESILVLNKIDLLKQKKQLLDVTASLTGGYINGIKYLKETNKKVDLEKLYNRTAKYLKAPDYVLENDKQLKQLVQELKECEKKLIEQIASETDSSELSTQLEDGMTFEKMKIDYEVEPVKSLKDISPFEFKQDLMNTTDWHLYYQKLSQLKIFTRERKYWPHFNQIFMVSAKENEGIEELRRYLFSRAQPGKWMFARNFVTDQLPRDIALLCVREKMLENLPQEIPYLLHLDIQYWDIDENDTLNIVINIYPRKKKFKRDLSTLLGNGGQAIKQIAQQTTQELMNTFQSEVSLKLIVVTNKTE